ncbi:2-keto-4-pentenoate hydratase [Bradyrhizobium sp. SYSU BS000235]|uniref:2-keto-4-pentenoate hydratase n=1 Tax=Bradyrhizobium sp. SYSU BS000235 TaxID=3411332 RepID=UPI003C7317D3
MTTRVDSVIDVRNVAAEALSALDQGRLIAPFSSRHATFGLDDAYRVTPLVRQMREARGETALGRKIGFTNRKIWPQYNVYAPIWGYVYDRTVHDLSDVSGNFSLADLAQPRIEPEIVFGMSATPDARMDERELLSCIGWVASGYEIVQSIFPDWKFAPPDTVAAFGLHGALLIGERHAISGEADRWQPLLTNFDATLTCGDVVERGHARDVLDGPLSALRHLVKLLADDEINPQLAAGEIVTTGTLTSAMPVEAGEVWTTALSGIPLEGISIRFG